MGILNKILKIPMANHPLMTTLVPPESSIIGVDRLKSS